MDRKEIAEDVVLFFQLFNAVPTASHVTVHFQRQHDITEIVFLSVSVQRFTHHVLLYPLCGEDKCIHDAFVGLRTLDVNECVLFRSELLIS